MEDTREIARQILQTGKRGYSNKDDGTRKLYQAEGKIESLIEKRIEEYRQNILDNSTDKEKQAEKYVDLFIKTYDKPPTYKQVADFLKLKSTNTAYHRCRNFREKMKSVIK